MKYTILAAVLALLAGCATTFRPWMLSEVQEGMDRGQVVDLLGEPDLTETKEGAEFLYYSYSENYNPPMVDDTVLARDSSRTLQNQQIRKSFTEYRYVVKLVDGKVQNYKELRD